MCTAGKEPGSEWRVAEPSSLHYPEREKKGLLDTTTNCSVKTELTFPGDYVVSSLMATLHCNETTGYLDQLLL